MKESSPPKIIKNCINCHNDFEILRYQKHKLCSKKCSGEYRSKIIRENRNCTNCGSVFIAKKTSATKYCSKKCCGEHHKKTQYRVRDNKKQTIKKCNCCYKEYTVWNYRDKTSKFCSQECHFNSKNINNECIECGNIYSMPKWHKNKQITPLCKKCKNRDKYKRPLRKSYFELNVISLLKEKLRNEKVIEYTKLKINNTVYFPDITIGKNIIECQGDYWHCNPNKFDGSYYHKLKHMNAQQIWDYDEEKRIVFENEGYNVIYIWEEDFFNNKELSIDNIIKKLIK